jgi:MauM/NapG family ferredoxin protein
MTREGSNSELGTRNSERFFKFTPSRISQLFFLAAFLVLFVTTDYRGQDEISVAVNSFFRANPLVLVTFFLATGSFAWVLLPGLLTLVFSIILGRFFCGWICPLGTILDLVTGTIRKATPLAWLRGNLKYYLLGTLLFAALFRMNLAGLLDPIALLIRALTFFFYPLTGYVFRQGWVGLYDLLGDNRDYLAGGYGFLKNYLLPFREAFYPLAFLSLLLFTVILFLEHYERRNWCKNLCPLGSLLGLLGHFSIFKRLPSRLCADCGDCKEHCPTAFDSDILQKSNCIRCLECHTKCRLKRVTFRPARLKKQGHLFSPARRVILTSLASGFLLPRLFAFRLPSTESRLLRPPGVSGDEDFLKKCVRCGECMKVCPRNALYPASLQAGLYSLFTPMVIPRLGYCEYNCHLCGQVCPTGAIPNLPLEEKKKAIIGLAVVDKNHCLPYVKRLNCMVCEEHCPIPEKAIRFETVEETDYSGKKLVLKKPYIVEKICNGCGICEYVCPVEEKAAVEVFARTPRKR